MQQQNHVSTIVIAGLCVALTWAVMRIQPAPVPHPGPLVTLRAKVTDARDAIRLARFYAALADAVRRDATVIRTTGQFRTARTNAILVAFQGTDIANKYNITADIDARINAAMGSLSDQPITQPMRLALADALDSIAKELGE